MTWRVELRATRRPSVIVGGAGALGELRTAAARARPGPRAGLHHHRHTRGRRLGQTVVAGHLAVGAAADDVLTLPPGETTKRVETAARCWEWLAARGARRDDVVVALGGGVVGDLAGFVAATYLRGVGFWQVPTSLLAQVDSSVGGKVAIDLDAGKNLVGAFYQPDLVVVDPDTLATLPGAELAAGLGEVVKYGLLAGEGLLGRLEADAGGAAGARCARARARSSGECVAYKAAVVESDELDEGPRAVLNLGHTVGHALEVTHGYGVLAHGVAVGLGHAGGARGQRAGPRSRSRGSRSAPPRCWSGSGCRLSSTCRPPPTCCALPGRTRRSAGAGGASCACVPSGSRCGASTCPIRCSCKAWR